MTGKFYGLNTQHLQREEGKSHKKLESAQPTLPTGEKNICLQDPGGGICMSPSNTSQERAIYHVRWLLIAAPRKIKGCPLLSHTFTLVLPPWKGSVEASCLRYQNVGSGFGQGIHFHRDTCISTELNFWGTDLQGHSRLQHFLHSVSWLFQILFTKLKLSHIQSTGNSAR